MVTGRVTPPGSWRQHEFRYVTRRAAARRARVQRRSPVAMQIEVQTAEAAVEFKAEALVLGVVRNGDGASKGSSPGAAGDVALPESLVALDARLQGLLAEMRASGELRG